MHAIRLDVTDREAFARAADETERVLGNVHVLCNNAGVNLFNDIADATYQDWDWVLGVNLGGVVNGVVTFVPRIKAHGEGGHVVNTASMAAFVAGPGRGHLHDGQVRRCTGCRTRCAGACSRTGSASRWSARAWSRARSTRAT